MVLQCHVTNENHYISITKVLMTTKVGRMVTYFERLLIIKSFTLWPRGLATSCDILKLLYLHYHSVYGHQTCEDGDILWQAPNYKVTESFDHVLLQGHMTNKNHYISIPRVPMANKLGINDDFRSWDSTYNITRPLDHVALWDTRFTYRRRFNIQTL